MSEFEGQFRAAFLIIIIGTVLATVVFVELITWVFA
jgi:hypothetical protein